MYDVPSSIVHRFNYRPQFKVWLSSNHMFNIDVTDDAAWGRVRVIPFPYSNLGKEDKKLKECMSQPDFLMGVLAWAVEGARRWYSSPRGLLYPEAVKKATEEQRIKQDKIHEFIVDRNYRREGSIPIGELYNDYKIWCVENCYEPEYINNFSGELKGRDFVIARKSVYGKTVRLVIGLSS